MGAESCEKSLKFFGNFWSETLVNNTFCARSLWVDESFVHGSGGMRRRVWFKIQKLRSLPREAKNRTSSPSPARSTWHAAHNAKRPARPTNQYVWHSIWRYPTKRLCCQSNSRKTSWTHLRPSQTCLEVRRSVRLP